MQFTAPGRLGGACTWQTGGRLAKHSTRPKASRLLPASGKGRHRPGRHCTMLADPSAGPEPAAAAWSLDINGSSLQNSQATHLCRKSGNSAHTTRKLIHHRIIKQMCSSEARFASTNHASNTPGQTCSSFDMRLDAICAASQPEASASLASRS